MYNTKIKGLIFRFHFDVKKALVSMDVEHADLEVRITLWEKVVSLKSIIKDAFLPNAIFEDYFLLDNGKEISRVYIELDQVSIHNKSTWQETMAFFSQNMDAFECFFGVYKEFLEA